MRHRLALVAWSAVVLALAAVPLAGAYRSAWAVAVLALAAALPFGLVALGLRLGVRRWATAVAGVALGLTGAAVVLRPTEQTGPVPTWRTSPALEAFGPLLDAVPRLLTAPRPAPATPDLLAPVVLLVWLTALVVALVVVPATVARAAPLVGAAVLYAGGALLSAGQADRHGLVAVAVVLVLAVGWTVLPGRDAPTDDRPRAVAFPVAATTIAAAFGLVAGALPVADAFEPRVHVPPPQLPADATNPVPEVAAWNLDADRVLLTVRPGAQQLPERLVLATLTDFDGAAWTLDARLRAIGVVDEPTLPDGARRAGSDLTVVLEQLGGVWVPSSGTTTAADGAELVMDVDTGTLVLLEGVAAGTAVHLTGERDAPTEAEVARAGVPPAADAARYLELPRLPAELRAEAAEVTAGASSRLEQALAIEEAVRAGRTHDLAAQSGSSYGRLMEFLFLPAEEAGQVGSAEQFAGAFAVLARAVGLPTRLVVGFDLARAAEDGDIADGGLAVRGSHATIWAEVYFAGAGWVPFAPTPDESTTTPPQSVEQPQDPAEDADEPGEAAAPPPQQADPPPAAEEPQQATSSGIGAGAGTAIGVGGLLVLVLLALLTARLVRRRRWRAAGARGAWAQVLDAVALAGERPGPGDTPPDVVRRLDPTVRAEALLLATRAESEAFAPQPPTQPPTEPATQPAPLSPTADLSSRADLSLTADLSSRADLPPTADLSSRADLPPTADLSSTAGSLPRRGGDRRDWSTAVAVERSLRRTQHWPSRVWWWFTPRVWRR